MLQANITMYCWGRRRSGAIEHVLDKYGLNHSSELYRINGKEVGDEEWRWLKQMFLFVHRLFDDLETGDTVGKVRWINVMQCGLAYEVMRRECHHYRRNLYPKGSALTTFLKRSGVEVEDWYDSSVDRPSTPPPASHAREQIPPSSGSNGGDGAPVPSSLPPPSSLPSGGCLLGEREWLSDVHMANLMFLLLCGQLVLPLEMRDLIQCLYPMTDVLLEQMLRRADPGSLLMHAKVGHGVTVAFVNPSNNHWRLVVLDGLHRVVTLFDPLGAPLPSTLIAAIADFVGSDYRVMDARCCLQAESWNCGIWAAYVAAKYVTAMVEHVSDAGAAAFVFQPWRAGDDFSVLDTHSTASQRHQNRAFATDLRRQYSALLTDGQANGRLLYTADGEEAVHPGSYNGDSDAADDDVDMSRADKDAVTTTVRAGTALSATRHPRFIDRPLSELVWIDLTDSIGTIEVEQEEEVEQSYDDLCDQYIEFREDNINNSCAAALRYSLPAKMQSDVLKEQIEDFRAYRRQRFSLFRKGPLVEESTIASNISSLLRFLGYLHYDQASVVLDQPLDMSVFALPTISFLVLSYVEWLEQRRGKKQQAADDTSFQPVTCATVANYLNGLVNIVKFQLRHDLQQRDTLLDQLHNLRSQAESYSMTQKKFEKAHPQWCSWQELQVAREKCRAAFDQRAEDVGESGDKDHLLHLREVCLMCFFTICPPPRCSIIRLLEWDKTLVQTEDLRWAIDLTDLTHAATRHKTHKRKGALQLPLPSSLSPYLGKLRGANGTMGGPVFPIGSVSRRASSSSASPPLFLSPTSFTSYVKSTFGKYCEGGRTPNPSLLRSIFTTWLYGLRYDTEDGFLQEIKSSSARWKAHSEQVARTVYNKELVYQQKEFRLLLQFCEAYSARHAYDRPASTDNASTDSDGEERAATPSLDKRRRRKRSRELDIEPVDKPADEDEAEEYAVEALVRLRVNSEGEKQVLVKWEGYHKRTWEPYHGMQEQLPELMAELEAEAKEKEGGAPVDEEETTLVAFLHAYIAKHRIDRLYRWRPDQINALEHTAYVHQPRIKETADQLRKDIVALLSLS